MAAGAFAQSTTGEILGLVQDPSGASVADAKVTVRSLDTNAASMRTTGVDGSFRFPQIPIGSYEVTVERSGFARQVQGPIVLRLNQNANLDIKLQVAGVAETITVSSDAPLINTTNAEIGINFDSKRISELPLAPNRNLMNIALSVPGVSQVSAAQSGFAQSGNNGTESAPLAFSANGMRLRSNNFMINGQDVPEFGRAAGSVVNIVTKSGTNEIHGTAFWYHNNNKFNSLSTLDKAARFTKAPYRTENQFGGTFGGPVVKEKPSFSFPRSAGPTAG